MVERKKLIQNHRLFKEAQRYLVGGVNSPVRAFGYVGGNPILVKRGQGSKIYDYDGNKYIDYVLSWGSLILGHAHQSVIKEIKQVLNYGLGFGTTHKSEIELARIIQKAIPGLEKIRFVNSGTEAVMGAIRLARGYTGRVKIIKFSHAYHGHADYLLAKSGSGLATLQIPLSKGVPRDFIKHTLVAPYGDVIFLDRLFKKYGSDIAAVIVEPVGGNYGVIPPDLDFLKVLRKITTKYKALLIFDEVITGFRFRFGAAADQFGIKPDLICLGKIIGGGLPIGAYGGGEKIMRYLAPLGEVYQSSTFAGNPVVMQAGIATLCTLEKRKDVYSRLEELTKYLSLNLEEEAEKRNIGLRINHFGSMFSLQFKEKKQFQQFYRYMLEGGIYFAPSEFEANFLSFAHTRKDIDETIEKAGSVFSKNWGR